jgi:hypothetical protein
VDGTYSMLGLAQVGEKALASADSGLSGRSQGRLQTPKAGHYRTVDMGNWFELARKTETLERGWHQGV